MNYLIFVLIFFCVGNTFADTKITELATQSMTSTATEDILIIVDTSGTPTTKSISINELDKRFYSENLTTDATFNTKLTVTATTYLQSDLILESPDGTCSLCGPDDSDTFACASITCP